jgi:hypothetical protein
VSVICAGANVEAEKAGVPGRVSLASVVPRSGGRLIQAFGIHGHESTPDAGLSGQREASDTLPEE